MILLSGTLIVPVVSAQTKAHGTLSTSEGPPIFDFDLARLLDLTIPTDKAQSSLVIFTQCYGGDCVDDLEGRAGTVALSATSPGQTAAYGGYDNDAAAALKPGASSTSDTIHSAGTAGKDSTETPSKTSGSTPIPPVNSDGPVKSRHVLVYAGIPDSTPGRDIDQRDKIESNFAGQSNTTVTTVGGAPTPQGGGQNGWDYPGTFYGLIQALMEIGEQMNSNEQFIMFVTDHGDLHPVSGPVLVEPQSAAEVRIEAPASLVADALGTASNDAGFGVSLRIPGGQGVDPAQLTEGSVCIGLADSTDLYTDFALAAIDYEFDGTVGVGDWYDLRFGIPEAALLPATAPVQDVPLDLVIYNNTGFPLQFGHVSLDSGPMPKSTDGSDAGGAGTAGPGANPPSGTQKVDAGASDLLATQVEFSPTRSVDLSAIGGTALFGQKALNGSVSLAAYLDADDDGRIGAGDTMLGTATAGQAAPGFSIPFEHSALAGETQRILIGLSLPAVQSARAPIATLLPALAVGMLALSAPIGLSRKRRRGLLLAAGVAVLLIAVVLLPSCGGSVPNPPEGPGGDSVSVTVRVDSLTATDAVSGEAVSISGLPLAGTTFEVEE